MSHVTGGTVIINDLDALWAACDAIPGLKVKRGQKTHRWYGRWMQGYGATDAAYKNDVNPKDYGKCEHAIEVRGSNYDIGVVRRKDGKGWTVVWDKYDTGLNIDRAVGPNAERLMKEYNRQVITKQARRNGWSIQTVRDGKVEHMILTKH